MKIITAVLMFAAALHAEWVTPHGKAFHTKRECIALRTTAKPEEITAKEAEKRGLHVCGICNRKEGKKK